MSTESDLQVPQKRMAAARLARILWLLPFVLAVPTFFAVGELIPNKHGGNASIADGFQRLNAFLGAILPITGICWFTAVVLTAYGDAPELKRRRKAAFWFCVSALGIFFTVVGIVLLAG